MSTNGKLADFTTDRRVVPAAVIATIIGALAAVVALILLRLIDLFTNLFFHLRMSMESASPSEGVWWAIVLAPIVGGLIIGLMARYGSEKIRGHGIPEALESILLRGSKVEPRLAVLKPLSAAISIGSGGPFGAEGPIIMTGGAFGSLIAQFFRLTAAERKTLLVAGAAAGMSATFAAPVASVLLAVELLLFEVKPRSLIPVALACAAAMTVRHFLLGEGPIFAVPPHDAFIGTTGILWAAGLGIAAGLLAAAMTGSVYFFEDRFLRLRVHWMWWPAIGGAVIGLGGLIEPRALGVGYEVIEGLLQGEIGTSQILLLMAVKWLIWSFALGSGTSGGVLAPLLMLGCALGGLLGLYLPDHGVGFWPLLGMGAILGGMMRAPLTGIVFTLELTHDFGSILPLLVACVCAHLVSVLFMKRSILTEKVARRGFHLTREYSVDPLEILFVRDVMRSAPAVPVTASTAEVQKLLTGPAGEAERLYSVVEKDRLVGVITRRQLEQFADGTAGKDLGAMAERPIVAHPDEPLREVAYRMAESGRTRLPVVDRADPTRLVGMLSLRLLLQARLRHLEEETRRERVFSAGVMVPRLLRRPEADPEAQSG